MMLSNQQQLVSLFYCLGLGVWIGTASDLSDVCTSRRPSRAIRFLRDVLFATASGMALFLLALALTGGEVRPSMVLAAGIGAYVGHCTCGRFLRRLLPACIRRVRTFERIFRHYAAANADFLQKTAKKAVFFSKKGLRTTFYMLYNKKRP